MLKLIQAAGLVLLIGGQVLQCAEAQTSPRLVSQYAALSQRTLPGYVTNKPLLEPTANTVSAPDKQKGYSSGDFIATTTSTIEGYTIVNYKGLVEGASVRVPTWSEDAAAGTQEVYGGSITSYTQLCEEARVQAFTTMIERAKKLGANSVIGIHFDSQVMPLDKGKFATGVVCVGTAVVAKRIAVL